MSLTREEAVEGREVWVAKAGRAPFRARIVTLHGDERAQFPWATLERLRPAGPRTQAYLADLEPVGGGSDEVQP